MEMPKVIYIMGPPGAGKGTQAMLLCSVIAYEQFSTGDAFRKIARMDTPLGKKVDEIMSSGMLCPPELAAEVVTEAIKDSLAQGKKLIFDGTPRTEVEAKIVDRFFVDNNYGKPLAIYLETDKETMAQRNSKRQFCLGIEGGFPIIFKKDLQRCSGMGGTVGVRADDDPSKFEVRWQEFMERTWPVIARYKEEGILHTVNGKLPVQEVHKQIVQLINQLYDTEYSHDYTKEWA